MPVFNIVRLQHYKEQCPILTRYPRSLDSAVQLMPKPRLPEQRAQQGPVASMVRKDTARVRLLTHLKQYGAQTTAETGHALGITVEAARQQLQRLVGEDLVEVKTVPSKGRGRPQKRWSLTANALSEFPDAHSDVLVGLIQSVQENFGTEGLEQLLCTHGERVRQRYQQALVDCHSAEARVRKLAELRNMDGYMAGYQMISATVFQLTENHCPIHSAARCCQNFCSLELDMFRKLLGAEVQIERMQHAMNGDHCCAYQISVTAQK